MSMSLSMSMDDESNDGSEIESDDVPAVSNDLAEQSDDTVSSIISVQRVNFSVHIVICIIDFDIVLMSLSIQPSTAALFIPFKSICSCRGNSFLYVFVDVYWSWPGIYFYLDVM